MEACCDMINKPLEFVRLEFEKNNSITPVFIEELYLELCKNPVKLSKIQSMNKLPISKLSAGKVVHFRCMVQDMYDSEFFFKVYNLRNKDYQNNILRCGLYQDIIQNDDNEEFTFESPHNKYGDRQVLYCVPIPGESTWAREAHNLNFADDIKLDVICSNNGTKRKLDDEDAKLEPVVNPDFTMDEDPSHKQIKANDYKSTETKCYSYKENFPLENESGYPAIVKVYNGDVKIDLNDTIEVFGVLSLDSRLSDFSSDDNEMEYDMVELRARNPHPIMVPRLHALAIRKLKSDHPFYSSMNTDVGGFLKSYREQLLTILRHCFHGDELLSEYLLCYIVSGVHSRRGTSALGKFSLNISNIPSIQNFIPEFYQVLCQLVNKCHLFPMTIENMNSVDMVPCKDYEENRLKPGMLQLSDRTLLVVDEVSLQPGKLEEKGVLNMAALSNLIERQEVSYNFKYHNQNFLTNVRVLVLSEGKSILKCDCHIPMVPSQQKKTLDDLKVFLTNSTLDPVRAFLCHSENIVPTLPDEVQEEIEKDFVERRKSDANKMAPEDLHNALTLARYVTLSHGSSAIGLDHWRKALEMEKQRKERIK